MTQIADIEVSRGNAKLASGVLFLLGILLFLNYGVARLTDLLAFQMWPSHVDMVVFIAFGSAVLYVVLMALPLEGADLIRGHVPLRVSGQAVLSRVQERLRPAVVHRRRDSIPTAQLRERTSPGYAPTSPT